MGSKRRATQTVDTLLVLVEGLAILQYTQIVLHSVSTKQILAAVGAVDGFIYRFPGALKNRCQSCLATSGRFGAHETAGNSSSTLDTRFLGGIASRSAWCVRRIPFKRAHLSEYVCRLQAESVPRLLAHSSP